MNKKKRILVVYTSFEFCGGVERFLLNFLNAFDKEQYSIDLLLFNDKQDHSKMFDMIPKHVQILPFLKQYSTWTPELMQELRDSEKSHMAEVKDFIHYRNLDKDYKKLPQGMRDNLNWDRLQTICPSYYGYDFAVALTNTLPLKIVADKVFAKKKYAFVHLDLNAEIEKGGRLKDAVLAEQSYYSKMDNIFCLTEQNVRSFTNIFPDFFKKTDVLANVYNRNDVLNQATAFYPLEYYSDKTNILTVARVHKQKGIKLLLETAHKLKNVVDFCWFILGCFHSNEYYKECIELGNSLDVTDQIVYLGERANPFPYYQYCDLYVQTSIYEGRCLSLEEARMLNCPIVTTNFTSVYDQITDGINGRICEMSPESLSCVIEEVLCTKEERERLTQSNNSYFGNNWIEKYRHYFS